MRDVYAVVGHLWGHGADGVHVAPSCTVPTRRQSEATSRGSRRGRNCLWPPKLHNWKWSPQRAHWLAAKAAKGGIMRQGKPKPPPEGGANGWVRHGHSLGDRSGLKPVSGSRASGRPDAGFVARGRLPSPSFKRSCSRAWWKILDIGA
ncbi:unnamed protein product [Heterosigma akashiwo]